MKYCNLIQRNGETLEIITEVYTNMFQNSDGSINQKVLGMYVHEWDCNRVVSKNNKLLICKTIDDAIIIEENV